MWLQVVWVDHHPQDVNDQCSKSMVRDLILCSPAVWLLYAFYLPTMLLLMMTSSSYYYQMMTMDGRCYLILAQASCYSLIKEKIESLIYWNVSSSLDIDWVYLIRPMALNRPPLQLQVVVTTVSHHPCSYYISSACCRCWLLLSIVMWPSFELW